MTIAINYIKGENKSHAELKNGVWTIYGASGILDQQEISEEAFKIARPFKEFENLPLNTPIYAAVHCFDNTNDDGSTYDCETLGDLYETAKEALNDVDANNINYDAFDSPVKYRDNLAKNKEAINYLAERIFAEVTWQSFSSFEPDLVQDIEDAPYDYQFLFNKEV